MEVHLKIIGALFILLAVIHVMFPRYFQWKEQLYSLSLINRQMMYIHTFFIALTVLLMGMLCLTSAHDLIHTNLGQKVALGFAIFWSIRLLVQFFGYSPTLWKGKVFEFTVHVVFSCFWVYVSAVFVLISI